MLTPFPFTEEQTARIRSMVEAEPCLFNARWYKDAQTVSNWLNEVGGKQICTPEVAAQIMGWNVPAPSPETSVEKQPDVWAEHRAKLGDIL